jgi:hypothetical protein
MSEVDTASESESEPTSNPIHTYWRDMSAVDTPNENEEERLDPRLDYASQRDTLSQYDMKLNAYDETDKHVNTTLFMLRRECKINADAVMQKTGIQKVQQALAHDAPLMSEPQAFVCGYAKHNDVSQLPGFGIADALRSRLINSKINLHTLADSITNIWKCKQLTWDPIVQNEYTARNDFYALTSSGKPFLNGFTLSLRTTPETYTPVYTCVYTPVLTTYASVLCGNDSCTEWDIASRSDGYVGPVSFMYFVIPNYYINGAG